jgi:hypothetical protein
LLTFDTSWKITQIWNIRKNLDWFARYLKYEKQKVDIDGHLSNSSTCNISVIHGNILGAILFLIYINNLYSASKLFKLMFADDMAGLESNKSLNVLINSVNLELKTFLTGFMPINGRQCI